MNIYFRQIYNIQNDCQTTLEAKKAVCIKNSKPIWLVVDRLYDKKSDTHKCIALYI